MERLRPNRKAAIILHDEDDDQDDQESMSDHEEWTPSDNDTRPKKPGGAKRRLHADSGSDDTETPAKRAKRPAAPRAPRVPKAPKEPKAPRAPRVPKAPRAPRVPKAPKEPKAPRAPRVPKAPKEPKAPKIPKATKAREKPETLSPRKPVAVKEEPPWSPGRGALAGIAIGVAGQALAIKPDPHTSTNREPHSHSATGPHVKKEPHSDSATGPHVKKEPHSHSATGPHVKKEPHSDSATGPHVKKEPVAVSWTVAQAVARQLALSEGVVQQVVRLLDEEYTIPFIARYRRELTNDMDADMLRQVEESVHQLRAVQKKVKSAVATLQKDDQLTARLQQALQECRCVEELEILVAPLKTSSRQSKAERARRLGLEAAAQTVLTEPHRLDMVALVRPAEPGLSTLAEVEAGVQHILADIIAKDRATMDMVRKMCENSMVMIESSLSAAAKTSLHKGKEGARDGGLSARSFHGKAPHGKRQDINNFEKYFSFQKPISRVENYEVLALNRGENLKILTVKINIPVQVKTNFHSWCLNQRWRLLVPFVPPYVQQLLSNSLEDSLKRLIIPLVTRHYRASLTRRAELASISLFAKNLRKLLLVPPVRGRSVLGIDPGFRHGCKLALTSPTGQVVATDVIFLDDTKRSQATVRNLLLQHRCETVAIGNGCGCREAECFVSELIQSGSLRPLNVVYSIVNENGASIYSVSPEAQQEMPGMDPNLRSAVSIARRLQDPLAELVKIDPKHLGIGMYQHDLPDAQLKVALRGVVQECVSFVGVDINACSVTLLGYVSGLSSVLARRIVEWREQQGPFLCRQQLLRVKGMGPKTFLQCAGFVRVNPAPSSTGPATSSSAGVGAGVGGSEPGANPAPAPGRKKRTRQGGGPEEGEEEEVANPLDRTWIHPESYAIAHRLLRLIGGSAEQVGRPELRRRVEAALAQHGSVEALAQAVGTTVPTLQIVLDGLKQPHDHDIRAELQKPIFRRTVMTLEELHVGMSLQGRVVSYTDFGAFVDIGVGQKALIPKRFITAQNSLPTGQGGADRRSSFLLGPGDRVEVRVHHMELARNRITLALERML